MTIQAPNAAELPRSATAVSVRAQDLVGQASVCYGERRSCLAGAKVVMAAALTPRVRLVTVCDRVRESLTEAGLYHLRGVR